MKKGLICFLLLFAIFGILSSCNNGDIEDIIDDNQDKEDVIDENEEEGPPVVETPCEFVSFKGNREGEYFEEKYTSENGLLKKMELNLPEYEEFNTMFFDYDNNNRLSGIIFQSYYEVDGNNETMNAEADLEFGNDKLTVIKLRYKYSFEDELTGKTIYEVALAVLEINYEGDNVKEVNHKLGHKQDEDPNIEISEDDLTLAEVMIYDFVDNNLVALTEIFSDNNSNENNGRKLPGILNKRKHFNLLDFGQKKFRNASGKGKENSVEHHYEFSYDDKYNPSVSFGDDILLVLGLFVSDEFFSVNNVVQIKSESEFYEGLKLNYTYTYNEHDLPATRTFNIEEGRQGDYEQGISTYGYDCN